MIDKRINCEPLAALACCVRVIGSASARARESNSGRCRRRRSHTFSCVAPKFWRVNHAHTAHLQSGRAKAPPRARAAAMSRKIRRVRLASLRWPKGDKLFHVAARTHLTQSANRAQTLRGSQARYLLSQQ